MLILYAGIIMLVLNAGMLVLGTAGSLIRASLMRGVAPRQGRPQGSPEKGHPGTALPGPQPNIRTYMYIRLTRPPTPQRLHPGGVTYGTYYNGLPYSLCGRKSIPLGLNFVPQRFLGGLQSALRIELCLEESGELASQCIVFFILLSL